MRKEGKAVAAGVTVQDNMHWASCPPVQLRRHASRPARRTKAKINILAKFVSEIIRKREKREKKCSSDLLQMEDVFLNLPLPARLLHCYALPLHI